MDKKPFSFVFLVGPPYTLRLKVKFYSSEPHTLREELTRYQFFLQLKQDLLEGRLKPSDSNDKRDERADNIEMCALALQCNFSPSLKQVICLYDWNN